MINIVNHTMDSELRSMLPRLMKDGNAAGFQEDADMYLDLYCVDEGDLMVTESSSYLVEDFVGEGGFGKVASCIKTATNEKVAVKILKNDLKLIEQAWEEIAILHRLRVLDPDVCGIVRWMGAFKHGPHICLEFELLDKSLFDLAWESEHRTLPLMQFKSILKQVATALDHLSRVGVIHGDLKPDNIMVTGRDTKVKLIDFGVSLHVSTAEIAIDDSFGHLWYKSPELMLGLPFTGMTDMWSLGCVAAQLLIGVPLYPGDTVYDMWQQILHTQGELPDAMLDHGSKAPLYFTKESGLWRLKSPQEYEREGHQQSQTRPLRFSSLEEVVQAGNVPGQSIPPSFTDLLKNMLQLDAEQRITPRALLEHPFIHLDGGDHADSCTPEPRVVHPDTPEPRVDHPKKKTKKKQNRVKRLYNYFLKKLKTPEPRVDHPDTPEPRVVHPDTPEPRVDHPDTPEPRVVHPDTPEPRVDHPDTPEPEDQKKATVDTTDSGKGISATPSTSCEVAMETVEVQKNKKKQSRVKRLYNSFLKKLKTCCC